MKKSLLFTSMLLASQLASADLIVSKADYFAGNYVTEGILKTKIIDSEYSFIDLENNLEFIKVNVAVGNYCNLSAELGFESGCAPTEYDPVFDIGVYESGNWRLGNGYDLISAVDNYSQSFHWPGAFGSSPDYQSFYYNNWARNQPTPHSEYMTAQEFVRDIVGWDSFDVSVNFNRVVTVDPRDPEKSAIMVVRESAPYANFNIRWNQNGFEYNSDTDVGGLLTPLIVRDWNGFDVLDITLTAQSATEVSAPATIALLPLGFLAMLGLRRRKK